MDGLGSATANGMQCLMVPFRGVLFAVLAYWIIPVSTTRRQEATVKMFDISPVEFWLRASVPRWKRLPAAEVKWRRPWPTARRRWPSRRGSSSPSDGEPTCWRSSTRWTRRTRRRDTSPSIRRSPSWTSQPAYYAADRCSAWWWWGSWGCWGTSVPAPTPSRSRTTTTTAERRGNSASTSSRCRRAVDAWGESRREDTGNYLQQMGSIYLHAQWIFVATFRTHFD